MSTLRSLQRSALLLGLLAMPAVVGAGEPVSKVCLDDKGAAELVSLVNGLRQDRGLGTVSSSSKLTAAAEVQSVHMSQQNQMGHAGPNGSQVSDRVEAQGYTYGVVAENVAAGQRGVEAVMAGWESSSSHLENMLRPEVVDIGVACLSDEDSEFETWWTMVLAAPLKGGR
ncbi:CAP domain-containing protein [Allohahella marinimesophila]|uniref:SCP domain-containing protein n=1 Tax=Allohahella marinimesophila TaxID=1054972 RepID=A0ABP7NH36_9GAMM